MTSSEMKVELLYFDGCPSYRTAEKFLREALLAGGLTDSIDMIEVRDDADARRLKFLGSPTIRLNGVDPFVHGEANYGMECRIYVTPDGLKGWPTKAMLREVLERMTG